MERKAEVTRKTGETDVRLKLNIDGEGNSEVRTGIGFFDHMLALLSRHGLIDMKLEAAGDLHVDAHHTVEDVGIVLGQAIGEALGEKKSVKRYGVSHVPMDEALAMAVVDLSGRPYLVFDVPFSSEKTGDFDIALVEEFFRAVAFNAGMTLHIKCYYGKNSHHISEAVFKAFARALCEAAGIDDRIKGVMSTKGIL